MTAASKLIETTDQHLNLVRHRRGKNVNYACRGRKVATAATLKRIRTLAIPPMWEDVLIAAKDNCHIQAIGRDQRGRKQYIYHEQWHLRQQQKKFERLTEFAQKLPQMRRLCLSLVRKKKWSKEKALALLVLILDETGIRIGNKQYLQANQSYGLTTLSRKHLEVHGRTVSFHFKGKSGQEQQVDIDDAALSALIKKSAQLPGHSIFRYQNDDGSWQDVNSDDVNEFIHATIGDEFSCKDFRTWVGTRLVLELYPQVLQQSGDKPRKKLVNLLVKAIADELGNTVAVCRSYYIHPTLLEQAEVQKLPVLADSVLAAHHGAPKPALSKVEKQTLELLRKRAGK